MYTVRRDDDYGWACAIDRDGYTVLHLAAGSERNEQEVEKVVALLNQADHQYPTPDAYEAACKALWKHRDEAARLRAVASDIAQSYYFELRTLMSKFLAANFFTAADAVEKLADRMKAQCEQALSTNPTGAERVRELFESADQDTFAHAFYRFGVKETLNALGVTIPGINVPGIKVGRDTDGTP